MTRSCNDKELKTLVDGIMEAYRKLDRRLVELLPNKGDVMLVEKEYLSEDINFDDEDGIRYVFGGIKRCGSRYFCPLGYEIGEFYTDEEPRLVEVPMTDGSTIADMLDLYFESRSEKENTD